MFHKGEHLAFKLQQALAQAAVRQRRVYVRGGKGNEFFRKAHPRPCPCLRIVAVERFGLIIQGKRPTCRKYATKACACGPNRLRPTAHADNSGVRTHVLWHTPQ